MNENAKKGMRHTHAHNPEVLDGRGCTAQLGRRGRWEAGGPGALPKAVASTTHVGLLVRDHHTETGSKSTRVGELHAQNPCSSGSPPVLQTGKQRRGEARSPAQGSSGTTGLRFSRKETTFSTRGDLLTPLMAGGGGRGSSLCSPAGRGCLISLWGWKSQKQEAHTHYLKP